ncbi:MAG: enoyl-CoA hydratase-related protein [Oxalobacter formigenes]|nr:enoyl-CoA hydratase-related protein [Oxalobacter formigenes]
MTETPAPLHDIPAGENEQETVHIRPEAIYVEREETVAAIVLNQPEKHNAISLAMWREIPGIVNALSADSSLRCIVLRGAGEEAFSSGCDISEFAEVRATRGQGEIYGKAMQEALAALYGCRHPVVAQVYGLCLGAGMELLAACDIRLCGESATFGVPAKNLGLVLSYPELAPLYHLLGPAALMEMLLEGRVIDSVEAREKQLVTRIAPDEALAAETALSVQRIVQGAPLTARWHKQFVRRLSSPLPLSPEENAECFDCYDTEDYRTGCAAFLLRDHPLFRGK